MKNSTKKLSMMTLLTVTLYGNMHAEEITIIGMPEGTKLFRRDMTLSTELRFGLGKPTEELPIQGTTNVFHIVTDYAPWDKSFYMVGTPGENRAIVGRSGAWFKNHTTWTINLEQRTDIVS